MSVIVKQSLRGSISVGSVFKGNDGVTFTPAVDDEGNLSWTNDGGLENPEVINIKGPKGDPGYTPVKGVDYFTEEDKAEILDDVLTTLPDASDVSF